MDDAFKVASKSPIMTLNGEITFDEFATRVFWVCEDVFFTTTKNAEDSIEFAIWKFEKEQDWKFKLY